MCHSNNREDAREYALENVNLHIQAGQTIGVIGTTGSAKTTLVQLIPRLYDATTGVFVLAASTCAIMI